VDARGNYRRVVRSRVTKVGDGCLCGAVPVKVAPSVDFFAWSTAPFYRGRRNFICWWPLHLEPATSRNELEGGEGDGVVECTEREREERGREKVAILRWSAGKWTGGRQKFTATRPAGLSSEGACRHRGLPLLFLQLRSHFPLYPSRPGTESSRPSRRLRDIQCRSASCLIDKRYDVTPDTEVLIACSNVNRETLRTQTNFTMLSCVMCGTICVPARAHGAEDG